MAGVVEETGSVAWQPIIKVARANPVPTANADLAFLDAFLGLTIGFRVEVVPTWAMWKCKSDLQRRQLRRESDFDSRCFSHTPHVPNITKTRRANVLSLYQAFVKKRVAAGDMPLGLERSFAKTLEISASMWSQIKKTRSISDKMARQIEHHTRQPDGWLDVPHADAQELPDAAEEHFLRLATSAWRDANAKGKRELVRMIKQAPKGG